MTKANTIGFWLAIAAIFTTSGFQIVTSLSVQHHSEVRERVEMQRVLVFRILMDAQEPLDKKELTTRYALSVKPFESLPGCPQRITEEELELVLLFLVGEGLLVTEESGHLSYQFRPQSGGPLTPRGSSPFIPPDASPPDALPTP